MKSAILILALLGQGAYHQEPGTAVTTPNPDYPLRLNLITSERTHDRFSYHGFGQANLLGDSVHGADYTYNCARGIVANHKDEFYQGKWKKQDKQIEVLVQPPGNGHAETCVLNVSLKPEPYTKH